MITQADTLIQQAKELAELGLENDRLTAERAEYVRKVNAFFDERNAAAREAEQND